MEYSHFCKVLSAHFDSFAAKSRFLCVVYPQSTSPGCFWSHSAVRCQLICQSGIGEVRRASRYRAVGRVSCQPTRRGDNYSNRFHPDIQRRLIPRRPFASWSVTERRRPVSLSQRHVDGCFVRLGRWRSCAAAAAGRVGHIRMDG